MIVGLKKRRLSKSFYDLGTCDESDFRYAGHYHGARVNVRTFNEHTRGWKYPYITNHLYVEAALLTKLCDARTPAACKNDECKYRFICFTCK